VSRQRGDDEQAEAYWAETVERAPEALLVRSAIVDKTNPPLERGVPGPEPTNFQTVVAKLQGGRRRQ
jgi:hypothetical protein